LPLLSDLKITASYYSKEKMEYILSVIKEIQETNINDLSSQQAAYLIDNYKLLIEQCSVLNDMNLQSYLDEFNQIVNDTNIIALLQSKGKDS